MPQRASWAGEAASGAGQGLASAGVVLLRAVHSATSWNTASLASFLAKELFVSFRSLWFQIWFSTLSIIFPFVVSFFPSRNGLRVCIWREQDGAAGPRQPDRRGPESRTGTTLPARPRQPFVSPGVCAPCPRLRLYGSLDPLEKWSLAGLGGIHML